MPEGKSASPQLGVEAEQNATLAIELRKDVWQETVKTWVDLRDFFRQRLTIVNHPALDFPKPGTNAPDWKGPLGFAAQGALVSILLVSGIGGILSTFVKQRPATILLAQMQDDNTLNSL